MRIVKNLHTEVGHEGGVIRHDVNGYDVVVAIVIEEGAAELVGYAQFVMIDHFRADAFKIGFPHAVLVDAVLDVCRGSVHAAQHLVSVDTGVLVTGE